MAHENGFGLPKAGLDGASFTSWNTTWLFPGNDLIKNNWIIKCCVVPYSVFHSFGCWTTRSITICLKWKMFLGFQRPDPYTMKGFVVEFKVLSQSFPERCSPVPKGTRVRNQPSQDTNVKFWKLYQCR